MNLNINNLDSWIKIDQLDVIRFIISPFTARHVSNVRTSIFGSLRLTVDLFRVLYFSGSKIVKCFAPCSLYSANTLVMHRPMNVKFMNWTFSILQSQSYLFITNFGIAGYGLTMMKLERIRTVSLEGRVLKTYTVPVFIMIIKHTWHVNLPVPVVQFSTL